MSLKAVASWALRVPAPTGRWVDIQEWACITARRTLERLTAGFEDLQQSKGSLIGYQTNSIP
jgi:hypothetical protein